MSRRTTYMNTGTVSLTLRAQATKDRGLEMNCRVALGLAWCPYPYPENETDTESDLELLHWERDVDATLLQAKEFFMDRLKGIVQHQRDARRRLAEIRKPVN
jgi:hypothetical protein